MPLPSAGPLLPCPNPDIRDLPPHHPVHVQEPKQYLPPLETRFYNPRSADPHLWPVNAIRWGFTEVFPTENDPLPPSTPGTHGNPKGYRDDVSGEKGLMYPAFFYNHKQLVCIQAKPDCSPPLVFSWACNRYTLEATLQPCWHCYLGQNPRHCGIVGKRIALTLPGMEAVVRSPKGGTKSGKRRSAIAAASAIKKKVKTEEGEGEDVSSPAGPARAIRPRRSKIDYSQVGLSQVATQDIDELVSEDSEEEEEQADLEYIRQEVAIVEKQFEAEDTEYSPSSKRHRARSDQPYHKHNRHTSTGHTLENSQAGPSLSQQKPPVLPSDPPYTGQTISFELQSPARAASVVESLNGLPRITPTPTSNGDDELAKLRRDNRRLREEVADLERARELDQERWDAEKARLERKIKALQAE